MQNAINSFRKGVNTKLASRLKKFETLLKQVTAQLVEKEKSLLQMESLSKIHLQVGIPGAPNRMPGGQGNNVHTALVTSTQISSK